MRSRRPFFRAPTRPHADRTHLLRPLVAQCGDGLGQNRSHAHLIELVGVQTRQHQTAVAWRGGPAVHHVRPLAAFCRGFARFGLRLRRVAAVEKNGEPQVPWRARVGGIRTRRRKMFGAEEGLVEES